MVAVKHSMPPGGKGADMAQVVTHLAIRWWFALASIMKAHAEALARRGRH